MRSRLKCIVLFLFFQTLISAQDTLVFAKAKDSSSLYKLPLGKYPIQIKFSDSLAFKAIIHDVYDTVISIKTYIRTSLSDSLIKELKDRYTQLSKQKHNKRKYRDSLNRELNFKILHVQYSVQRTIKTSRIRTITVINHYRPEKRKLIKAANVAAALFIAATLISADTQNPYIIGAGVGLTAISFIAKSIITSEDLDLIVSKKAKRKTKWKIAKVIRKS
ncbi:MAG: hypothetical protein IPG08_16080 [Sphingobacteriaceae bacterium]|nr:hypothetical protein [Sphingobacteriaceae bacterium]